MTAGEFSTMLDAAAPGARITYWEGCSLPADSAVRRIAWWFSERGLVHLVQKRLDGGRFAYIAVRRP